MDKIDVAILNPDAISNAQDMMVGMARLTQRGHKVQTTTDLFRLLSQHYSDDTVKRMAALPHPTLQKFGVVNIAIVGASRRFLAQITRHQNEVKFMSASLQYSDYSGTAQFVVPYELLKDECFTELANYTSSCRDSLKHYEELAKVVGNDAAGYAMPQGLRNVLIISATPYQWKHMISQRTCRRNTLETQYVMLRCWEDLVRESAMFEDCGPFCCQGKCQEGSMSCKHYLHDVQVEDYMQQYNCSLPTAILNVNFPLIRKDMLA